MAEAIAHATPARSSFGNAIARQRDTAGAPEVTTVATPAPAMAAVAGSLADAIEGLQASDPAALSIVDPRICAASQPTLAHADVATDGEPDAARSATGADTAEDAKQAASLGLMAMIFAPVPPTGAMPTAPADTAGWPAPRAVSASTAQAVLPALPQSPTPLPMDSAAPRSSPASAPAASTEPAAPPSPNPVTSLAEAIVAAVPGQPAATAAGQPGPAMPVASGASASAGEDSNAARLVEVLGQRLAFRTIDGTHQAVVRLEPYMAGTVRIEIRHEAGALQVHLSASNDEVVRQLQAIGDGLRQELSGRQYTDVSVHVAAQRQEGAGSQGQPQGQRDDSRPDAPTNPPGRALAGDSEPGALFATALDRLAPAGTRDP